MAKDFTGINKLIYIHAAEEKVINNKRKVR